MFVLLLTLALVAVVLILELLRRRDDVLERWKQFSAYRSAINAIPGPRSYPIIGTTYMMFSAKRAEIPVVLQKQYDEFPRLSRTWLGPFQAHIHVTRAEHLELVLGSSGQHNAKSWSYRFLWPWLGNGLLTASGEHWRTHRKIITPTFHFSILDSFADIFAEKGAALADKLTPFADAKQVVDVYPLIALAALDIVAEAAMGIEVHALDGGNSDYVAAITQMGELLMRRLIRPWLYPKWVYAWTEDGRLSVRTLKTLHTFTNSVIQKRMRALESSNETARMDNPTETSPPKRRMAFLDLLLSSNDTLSAQDIREEVDTFMFEGHDTTTSGMAWAMLLLGLHPDIQEQVYNECVDVFHGSDRAASLADLGRLNVLERVIKESMRLYPPVPNISRNLSEDIVLDGYKVPKGSTAIIELVHLHQDERFFPDHRRFDPDRFLPSATKGRHPFAYLPFSAGSRNCIGQKFAMFEEKAVLSTLVRRFRWKAALKSRHDVEYVYELITRPINGIPLVFESR